MTSDELRQMTTLWPSFGDLCKALCESADEIARLTARVAELERDAKRYRWLRDRSRMQASQFWRTCEFMDNERFDAELDAAMEAK